MFNDLLNWLEKLMFSCFLTLSLAFWYLIIREGEEENKINLQIVFLPLRDLSTKGVTR